MSETHKWDKTHNLIFGLLFVGGIALCIGGIWVPPLLVPGGVFLTGAFGMWASAYTRMYPWREDEEGPNAQPAPNNVTASPTVAPNQTFIQNNLFFVFVRKISNGGLLGQAAKADPTEEPRNILTLD